MPRAAPPLDAEALARAVVRGTGTDEFAREVETWVAERAPELREFSWDECLDKLWGTLLHGVGEVAGRHFARSSRARAQRSPQHATLLQQRRQARLEAISGDVFEPERIVWLTRRLRRLRRRERRAYINDMFCQLTAAWRDRDLAAVWKIMRQISGGYGPKFRRYDMPTNKFDGEEWQAYMARPPREGGCDATPSYPRSHHPLQ